jgi:3-phosphoshikimate 1-carboxyvinyltransferase
LPPARHAKGDVTLPGSKSISNRVLLSAALSEGPTRIVGLLDSGDTQVMLAGLRLLGIRIDQLSSSSVCVHGVGEFPVKAAKLFLGNAGTAFRPMTAALAMMGGDYELSGVPRMHERPIGDLVDGLNDWGARIEYLGQNGYPPLRIHPAGNLVDKIRVPGAVSSQFLTAVLMAAPLAVKHLGQPLTIEVVGELISRPYIELTLNLMGRFGVNVERLGAERFVVHPGAQYRSPGEIFVEGDASSASYFLAMGAIGGGPINVLGLGKGSIQGDIAFADCLEKMGANVKRSVESIEVSGVTVSKGEKLKAFEADFNLIPDAAMTAAALALFADGPCLLKNIGSWRVKETDRIHAMHTELSKVGAKVESGADWLRVEPVHAGRWQDAVIDTYDDHRMAMCLSLAAFSPAKIRIMDPGCVSKTFPRYFDVYRELIK